MNRVHEIHIEEDIRKFNCNSKRKLTIINPEDFKKQKMNEDINY